jgi:hypothetical protein
MESRQLQREEVGNRKGKEGNVGLLFVDYQNLKKTLINLLHSS